MPQELILLPATPCDARLYAYQAHVLSDLVIPSVLIFDEPDIHRNAESVLAAAGPKFFLAGTAYGGCLTIEVAIRAPHRVQGLCLINCNAGANPDPVEALEVCERLRSGLMEEVLAEWGAVIVDPGKPSALAAFCEMARIAGAERWANRYEATARRADHMAHLKQLNAPTLLLWGQDDEFVPPSVGREMATLLPQAILHEIPDCRHFPTLECPKKSTRLMWTWLQGILDSGCETAA